jgi:hypothetical protein
MRGNQILALAALIVGGLLGLVVLFQWIGYFMMPISIGIMLLANIAETLISIGLIYFGIKNSK